ncbi:MAG TPA: PP2C family protein-serine/threonine phosphatase [Streptosporangiaceae bacterium]|nr:PP2C family protein-serine/threonine phosphatase [Streptosporangiaceae bacterium]
MSAITAGAAAWRRISRSVPRGRSGIALDASGPAQPTQNRGRLAFTVLMFAGITATAAAIHGRHMPIAWLSVGPLLASLVLRPRTTAALAAWALLLGVGLIAAEPARPGVPPSNLGMLASNLGVLALLAGFAVANSALRTAAQRRLSQVRAVARVAQSALLREVPARVTAGRLASRYVSAAAEARVGGDVLEVVPDPARPRWLVGDTRGKGLPAVRLASVAMTSFRDACAQPGLSLPEIARVVDRSVTRAAEDEDFVTAVFAELDPNGWLQLVSCGHPPALRVGADGELRALTPAAFATPLGLHPDIQPSTFTVSPGDRLVFYTDGLLEARDHAGRCFRLEDCLDTLRQPDLQAAADALLARLQEHTGGKLDDDVALLLVEATSPPARPGRHEPAYPAPGRAAVPARHSLPVAAAARR